MGNGLKRKGIKGNGVRPVDNARGIASCLNAAASLPPRSGADGCRLLQLRWFIVFVSGTRGIVGGRACIVLDQSE